MAKQTSLIIVPDEVIMNKIYLIRGKKVMLDRDLSLLYEVETKQLKRAVRRNSERFRFLRLHLQNMVLLCWQVC